MGLNEDERRSTEVCAALTSVAAEGDVEGNFGLTFKSSNEIKHSETKELFAVGRSEVVVEGTPMIIDVTVDDSLVAATSNEFPLRFGSLCALETAST
jgi:hypothetical protein